MEGDLGQADRLLVLPEGSAGWFRLIRVWGSAEGLGFRDVHRHTSSLQGVGLSSGLIWLGV